MFARIHFITLTMAAVAAAVGCQHPEVTAVPLSAWNQNEPEAIPFYLPKPLLVIAKNFQYIEETKVGLTDAVPIPKCFDNQAQYADLNSRSTFIRTTNGTAPEGNTYNPSTCDALASPPKLHSGGAPVRPTKSQIICDAPCPKMFYTYQIVFVPDLTQKYGLKVKGGVGEIRAAMNLVNGWQFTGLGPYYMKDSSTAQNILAGGISANLAGSGVADVLTASANLSPGNGPGNGNGTKEMETKVNQLLEALANCQREECYVDLGHQCIEAYAEIHVFEPYLTTCGTMEWRQITPPDMIFSREILGAVQTKYVPNVSTPVTEASNHQPKPYAPPQPVGIDPEVARAAIDGVLGVKKAKRKEGIIRPHLPFRRKRTTVENRVITGVIPANPDRMYYAPEGCPVISIAPQASAVSGHVPHGVSTEVRTNGPVNQAQPINTNPAGEAAP